MGHTAPTDSQALSEISAQLAQTEFVNEVSK